MGEGDGFDVGTIHELFLIFIKTTHLKNSSQPYPNRKPEALSLPKNSP